MNQWAVQPKAFGAGGEQSVVVCPKPRRIGGLRSHPSSRSLRCYLSSHQVESKAETDDILDLILTTKDGHATHTQVLDSPSPFLCGSPPSRVANPLTQDARFRDEIKLVSSSSSSPITAQLGQPPSSPSSSARKGGGCVVRGNFGNSPAVRIEGFDCLDRDRRNCSIPALA